MSKVTNIFDNLRNVVSGLGGRFDKSTHSAFIAPFLNDAQILNAYRGSAIPKKIVDIPPFDACREWREWSGEADQVVDIVAIENKLKIRQKVRQAMTLARLYGGSAILIGTGDVDLGEPLNTETVKKDGLKYITVLSKHYITAGPVQTDAVDADFGKPEYYNLNGAKNISVQIHPSRLAIFTGAELPDEFMRTVHTGWGDSVLLSLQTELKNLEATAQTIASLIFEAKIDIVKIPEMMTNLANAGDTYEKSLLKRWELAALAKGNHSILLMDKEEDYQQKQMNFANLPALLDRFMQLVAAAADIPATRMFGTSPAGLNATGESDLRNYYDRISAMQTLEMSPAIAVLDECLIRSALGGRPEEINFVWKYLWQTSEKEKAETGKLYSEIIEKLSALEVISDDALAESLVDVLTGSEIIAGLAAAVEKYPDTEGGADEV